MMTKNEIADLVQRELREYRYVRPSGTLGVPFRSHRWMPGEELKRSLREPDRVLFADGGARWIVTETDGNGYFVFFDENAKHFGLVA